MLTADNIENVENIVQSSVLSDVQIEEQYKSDKENIENFLNGKTQNFDYQAWKKLVITELSYNKTFTESTFCGFNRCEIERMAEHPDRFGRKILMLSDYMYCKSGYYKRLIDYFANQAMINYTVDTQITNLKAYGKRESIKRNYISFAAQAEKFNLKNQAQNIFRRLYRNDVVFAFVIETDIDISYYYLNPVFCNIEKLLNGNVYEFSISTSGFKKGMFNSFYDSLPEPLQKIIDTTPPDMRGRIHIPAEQSLCLKYNNDFLFPYPPFFMMIADILLIDDYKDLAKSQSINDAYKILTMKIPTKDGQVTMDGGLIGAFTSPVLETVQNNIGVVTTPFDMDTEEFSSSNADDRDTVSDAISWAFKNVGVSEALMSGASNGTELKYSILNDSGDVFRIYRQIEDWILLQMKLRGYIYKGYNFVYQILNMTIFNVNEVREKELSMSQNGIPNKMKLCAANDISPISMFGNSMVENDLFSDIIGGWLPLQTSYTMSDGDNEAGRPQIEDTELSDSGQVTRENGSNENRSVI